MKRGLKVRILAGHLDRRAGSHVYHVQLARRLAARGHAVSVICFSDDADVGDVAEVIEIEPLDVHAMPLIWRYTPSVRLWSCERQLRRLVSGYGNPDVVIAGEHLFLRCHHRLFPNIPWIYHPHSYVVTHEVESYNLPDAMARHALRVYGELQRYALEHSTRIMRFTKSACQVLLESYGEDCGGKFVLNPMGIDIPDLVNKRESNSPVKLLCLGSLIQGKNIELAINAVGELTGDWVLDVVGDGNLRSALEKQADEIGIAERVTFHGFQPDPAPFLKQADLLLFPSFLENSPTVVLECMSYGVPCLAMAPDGKKYFNANPEIITHGESGILAGSEAEFCHLLSELLDEREAILAMGVKARNHVVLEHSWDRHLDRCEDMFRELV